MSPARRAVLGGVVAAFSLTGCLARPRSPSSDSRSQQVSPDSDGQASESVSAGQASESVDPVSTPELAGRLGVDLENASDVPRAVSVVVSAGADVAAEHTYVVDANARLGTWPFVTVPPGTYTVVVGLAPVRDRARLVWSVRPGTESTVSVRVHADEFDVSLVSWTVALAEQSTCDGTPCP